MVADASLRLLLRAELIRDGRAIIAHTMEISESAAFVLTDETGQPGERVQVKLSFPGLVEPISLEAQFLSQRLPAGPGEPGGWSLGFVFYDDEECSKLRSLLKRLRGLGAPSDADTHVEENGTRYRVLLVEDNKMTRDVFSFGAAKHFRGRQNRVHVDVAETAEEAWTKLVDSEYDLAIVDYFLPSMNGDELIGKMRADERLAGMPVVAISVGGGEARDQTLNAGADLFLDKPLVLRDLFSTLERLTLSEESAA